MFCTDHFHTFMPPMAAESEVMMDRKKIILIASLSGGAAFLILLAVIGILIGNRSRSAADAAAEFENLLSQGRLAELEARFYLPENGQDPVIYGEDQTAQIRFVTPAELAERFGADAVLAGQETSQEEELLSVVMRYSTLRVTTGAVTGNRTSARLTLIGPDFDAWLSSLEPEEAERLVEAGEGFHQVLEEFLSEASLPADALPQAESSAEAPALEDSVGTSTGFSVDSPMDIPMRTVSQSIPMQKRNGSWRFAVTEEQEREWFCGLLPAAASEPTAVNGQE